MTELTSPFRDPASETDHLRPDGKRKYRKRNKKEQQDKLDERIQRDANEVIEKRKNLPTPSGRRYEESLPWWDK